jgi:hypothetical protein
VIDPGARIEKNKLFSAYERWCKQLNFMPLASTRFLEELKQAVPGSSDAHWKEPADRVTGKRRSAYGVTGLYLDADSDAHASEFDAVVSPGDEPATKPASPEASESPESVDAGALDTSWMHEEPVKSALVQTHQQLLVAQLGVSSADADRFVEAGFASLDDIRGAPGFVRIPGFSEGYLRDLQNRAREIGN